MPLRVIGIVAAVVLMLGLWFLVDRTRTGKAMRATSIDRDAAAMMGIDIDRVIMFAFVLSGALAGAAGVLFALRTDLFPLHAAGKTDIQSLGGSGRSAAPDCRRIRGSDLCARRRRHRIAGDPGAGRRHGLRRRRGAADGRSGYSRKPKEAAAFYAVLALSAGFGIALNFTAINAISALYWSAVINGVLAVPVMVLLMFVARRPDVIGPLRRREARSAGSDGCRRLR